MRAWLRALHGPRLVAAAILLVSPAAARAQSASFLADCKRYIDQKGYSTDYIEEKTGKRQPGLAAAWRGNVAVREVQPGDVVLIRLRVPGAMHAALAEEIARKSDGTVERIRVSEWNWGRTTDARCLVTENFGRLAPERWVDPDAVAYVWRPSLPL